MWEILLYLNKMASIFYHINQSLYQPENEFIGNSFRKYPENTDRITSILEAVNQLNNSDIKIEEPELITIDALYQIHSKEYIDFLQTIPNDIEEISPTAFSVSGYSLPKESSFFAKLGYYFFDPATPLTPSSFSSALASASSANAVSSRIKSGDNISIALCRPPGHHALIDKGGGYCFINNIALTAKELIKSNKSISILDLDYHHGNGTQEIFYTTSKVQYVSIHADPSYSYPFYWGYKQERGEGDGLGFNINYPISDMSTEKEYRETLDQAINDVKEYNPDILLLSMGFDTYYLDPIAGMGLTETFYYEIGEKLSQFPKLGIILEGGYHIASLGKCFTNLYKGYSEQ